MRKLRLPVALLLVLFIKDASAQCDLHNFTLLTAASGVTPTSVSLGWESAGPTPIKYTIYYRLQSAGSYIRYTGARGLRDVTIQGLTPGSTYYFYVSAHKSCGIPGEPNEENTIESNTVVETTLFDPPASLSVSAVTTQSFVASWSPAPGATSYRLDVSTDPTFSVAGWYRNIDNQTVSGTSIEVPFLVYATTYYFRVRSANSAGLISASSYVYSVSTAPLAPISLDASAIDVFWFTANWNATVGAASYRLDVATDSTFTTLVNGYNNLLVTGTSQLVTGLQSETVYYYRVRAINGSNGSSANSNPVTLRTGNGFRSAGGGENPFEVNIIPPSPEAAALAKYADMPVGLYTGTPHISIPIYEIKERELSLPISLNYHAGGNKVEAVAPRTGLGWTLDAGGAVTRAIRGWPDEYGIQGFLYTAQHNQVGDFVYGTPQEQYEWYDAMAQGCKDTEPDVFYFNFAGYTGKFMFDWDGQIKIMSGNFIKLEPVGLVAGTDDFIDGWKITVDDGTIFTFSAVENTQIQLNPFELGCKIVLKERNIPEAWYLTEMRSANQQSWIQFEYEPYFQPNVMWALESRYYEANQLIDVTRNPKEVMISYIHGQNLKRITTSSGQCTLTLSATTTLREDIKDPYTNTTTNYALQSITINNTNSRQIGKWDFGYSYVTGRLTLTDITETAGSLVKPPYEFSYYPIKLPSTVSYARDHWGFFNSNTYTTLIPPLDRLSLLWNYERQFYYVRKKILGANRSPDSNKVMAGMLKQITYPTQGKDVFEFEPHDYSFEQTAEIKKNITTPEKIRVDAPDFNDGKDSGLSGQEKKFTLEEDEEVEIFTSFGLPVKGGLSSLVFVSIVRIYSGSEIEYYRFEPNVNAQDKDESTGKVFLPAGDYVLRAKALKTANGPLPNNVHARLTYSKPTGQTMTPIRQGGGVRIARLTRSYGFGNPDKITNYIYRISESGTTKSSGSLLESALIYEVYLSFGSSEYVENNPIPHLKTVRRLFRFSQNKTALGTTQGSHVCYSNVTVSYGDGGKSAYHYLMFADIPSFESPFPPAYSLDYARGLLLDQTDFKTESNDTLKHTQLAYSFHSREISALKVGMNIPGDGPRGSGFLDRYSIAGYTTVIGYTRLIQRHEKIFETGTPLLETVADYKYNETTHKQLTSSSTTNSKGETIVSSFKYPHDYSSPTSGITAMIDRNMVNVALENVTWKKGSGNQVYLLSGLKTDYGLSNNRITPTARHSAKITQPMLTSDPYGTVKNIYEPRLLFTAYDNFANLVEHSRKDGEKISYQWGYSGTLPIAKVEHATARQIFHEGFEEDAAASTTQRKTGKKSKMMSGPYTVPTNKRPNVTGDYILSYWTQEGTGAWTYREKLIQNYTAGSSITSDPVNGYLDEIRLYPKGALMTTFTYEPLVGVTSVTDPTNVTTYFEFDDFGRLKFVQDQDKNIIQSYDYQLKVEVPYNAAEFYDN